MASDIFHINAKTNICYEGSPDQTVKYPITKCFHWPQVNSVIVCNKYAEQGTFMMAQAYPLYIFTLAEKYCFCKHQLCFTERNYIDRQHDKSTAL